jgi:adenylate cyclase
LPTSEVDGRLNRALTAYLRQEVQAPVTAVTDFLDILIEDARRLQLDQMLPDLDRIHSASVHLNAFVTTLIDDSFFGQQKNESLEAFHRRLRHDLRTPLNAIKGYSELLIEDTQADNEHPLRSDLVKLKESADQLIKQIDAMVALNWHEETTDQSRAYQLDIVAGVLRAVQPLQTGIVQERIRSSHVLVVDDNASNRDVLARRLTREGHKVVTAANGTLALDLASKHDFDLILLDLIMPEMSGFEVLRRLKAAEHTSHIPVIIISALDEIDSVVRCIEVGAEDYLAKPFNPIMLRARINASLEKKWLRDREKKFMAELEQEKRRSETLLLNILPQKIVDRIRNGETVIADRIAEATIMFCDLVGFTVLSQDLPADRTIDFLNKIFSSFDQLAAEQGVEKIKTIGDAYMVVGGIPEPQPDHAVRIAVLALRMMKAVADIAKATNLDLRARIGIHTGSVIAGVIGTHKFVYDVWGDAVNTASRMESHSLPGRIQISAATRRTLGEQFKCEPRESLEIKGKGLMDTYFLNAE